MRARTGALVGSVALLLAGCGGGGGAEVTGAVPGLTSTTVAPSSDGSALEADDLDARRLVAEADDVDGYRLADDTTLELSFQPGLLTVHAGCLVLSAPYELVEDRLAWRTDPLTAPGTCRPERQFQDRWIADRLVEGLEASVDGDGVALRDGEVVIRLRDDPTGAIDDAPLIGTTWLLATVVDDGGGASTVAGGPAPPRLRIAPSGAAELFDGCNEGSVVVAVEADGAVLRFGPIQATGAECDGPVAEVAEALAATLDGTVFAQVDGRTLTIAKGDRTLVLRAE